MDNTKWTMDNGQWTMVNGESHVIYDLTIYNFL